MEKDIQYKWKSAHSRDSSIYISKINLKTKTVIRETKKSLYNDKALNLSGRYSNCKYLCT